MKNVDVELIQRVLNGDDTAFSALVRKYQKSVHALAWRKIGDFHIAEDITQDTFLKAYQELSTLKEPQSFASWLYVIAANRCTAWLRKKRLWTQSLENTNSAELEKATYSNYVISENERATAETQREVVKKLLAKLQESDRTVMTLYYLGGMTYEEISKFLGVSVSAIKNRLYRARQHLKKEEPMIKDVLENFQITPHLTENIMREVARLKPAAPSASKPFVPWAIAVSSAILIVLMLGIGSQHLLRFQKPYSLDAQAEMTVELVDAPLVLNLEAKPDIQNQPGSSKPLGKSDNRGQKPDAVLFAAAQAEGEDVSVSKQEWIQSEPIRGSFARSLHATPEGDLFVYDIEHTLYKLPANGTIWQSIFKDFQLDNVWGGTPSIAKWNNTLYFIVTNKLFASKDEGKTWDLLYSWQEGNGATKFVRIEQTLYLAFENGIFKSDDFGKTWKAIHDEKMEHIESLVIIQNTLFVRTYNELYRLEQDKWKPLEFPVPVRRIISVAGSEDKLYIAVLFNWEEGNEDIEKIGQGLVRGWWIFRSTDLGDSWKDITPTNAWPLKGWPPDLKLIANDETLLVMEQGMVRSTDAGNTWMPPQLPGTTPSMNSQHRPVVVIENTIYVGSQDGLHRSTDGGKSWDMIKITQDKERRVFRNLIAYKGNEKRQNMLPTLYGIVDVGFIVKTTDEGKSWKDVQVEIPMTAPLRENPPRYIQIITSGDAVYAKGGTIGAGKMRLYRVSEDGNTLEPIQGMPTFDSLELREHLYKSQNLSIEALQEKFSGATQFFKQLLQATPQEQDTLIQNGLRGPFAVSDDTFYMEYNFKLFRWEPGDTEWQDIGQEETSNRTWPDLKLAVSGETVYAGKRDGSLVVSFDRGNKWIDLTPALPFPVKAFKDIVSAGSTVHVATDTGIITSDDGRNWRAITDAEGKHLIMDKLAVDGTMLYGITERTVVYRLERDSGTWKQIVSEIPAIVNYETGDLVTSLAAAENTLYVATERNGVLHFNLEK